MSDPVPTIFIVSDGTGETASTMVRAALIQYEDYEFNIVRCKNIREEEQVLALLNEVQSAHGFIAHTIVSDTLRKTIETTCKSLKIPCVDLFGPLLHSLDSYFNTERPVEKVGKFRMVSERYFKRIAAMEYTVKHDDGKILGDLDQADIVLVGISRTSKTPLSVFLGHKGWKVANIPIVLNVPLPTELFEIDQRRVIGLTIDPSKLTQIRKKRLEKLGPTKNHYADLDHIYEENEYALSLFKKNKRWPVFDVTERALEETAVEITRLIASRLGVSYFPF